VTAPAGTRTRTPAAALGLLRRHPGPALAAVATAVNTVPDVLRQVLVWDDRAARTPWASTSSVS